MPRKSSNSSKSSKSTKSVAKSTAPRSRTPRRAKSGKATASYRPAKLAPGLTRTVRGGKGRPTVERTDKGQPGSVAIDRLPEPARSIARATDQLLRRLVPGCDSVVKWGNAVYRTQGRAFAAIHQTSQGVNLALPGGLLDDPHGLLEGTGKVMRHVKVRDQRVLEHPGLPALVAGAAKVGLKGM